MIVMNKNKMTYGSNIEMGNLQVYLNTGICAM